MFESSRKVAKEASELISDLIGTILETDADLVRAIKTLNSSNFETCYGLMHFSCPDSIESTFLHRVGCPR